MMLSRKPSDTKIVPIRNSGEEASAFSALCTGVSGRACGCAGAYGVTGGRTYGLSLIHI